ncbi:MAG: NADH-quinone oxidoreductase subunit NuoK [Elusimicrobia bacterium]|nr:NADH-quinone oxidoreductase subunit NuoK [Elusimicrobiota bacterium]
MTLSIWGVSVLLFLAGLAMVVLRRQLLAMLLGLELMINSVNIALVYTGSLWADAEALSAALLILAIAAAEVVVGLSLILKLNGAGAPVDSSGLSELKG